MCLIYCEKKYIYIFFSTIEINLDIASYLYDNPYINDCEKIVTIDLNLQEIKINCRTIVLMHLREKLVPTNSSA